MRFSTALSECADMLAVAAEALKRMARSEAEDNCSPDRIRHIEEVAALASRLKELSELIAPAADS